MTLTRTAAGRDQNLNQFDLSPRAHRALSPEIVTVLAEPTKLIVVTRPPQSPWPLRLVTASFLSVPTDG